MKELYISPKTIVVEADLSAFCNDATMTTKTEDNTGGDEKGPSNGLDNGDAGAKKNPFSAWDDLDDEL